MSTERVWEGEVRGLGQGRVILRQDGEIDAAIDLGQGFEPAGACIGKVLDEALRALMRVACPERQAQPPDARWDNFANRWVMPSASGARRAIQPSSMGA